VQSSTGISSCFAAALVTRAKALRATSSGALVLSSYATTRTAEPLSAPERRRSSASFASSSGNVSTSVVLASLPVALAATTVLFGKHIDKLDADAAKKIRTMPTDPARVKRADPGEPEKCPVWQLHLIYSDEPRKDWVQKGCRSAGIGCLECKQPVIEAVNAELAPIRARAPMFTIDAVEPRISSSSAGCDATSAGTSGASASGITPASAIVARMSLSARSGRPCHGVRRDASPDAMQQR